MKFHVIFGEVTAEHIFSEYETHYNERHEVRAQVFFKSCLTFTRAGQSLAKVSFSRVNIDREPQDIDIHSEITSETSREDTSHN